MTPAAVIATAPIAVQNHQRWTSEGSGADGAGAGATAATAGGLGGTTFASRQAVGLAYYSQRATVEDRAVERSLKAMKRLGVNDTNMLEMPWCPKPKWMRRHTHARLVGVIAECHQPAVRIQTCLQIVETARTIHVVLNVLRAIP